MKVGEWYSANSPSNPHYCIRIIDIVDEMNTSGENNKIFSYFYITTERKHGEHAHAVIAKLKDFSKVKDLVQLKKLEGYYKKNAGESAEAKLKDFIEDL